MDYSKTILGTGSYSSVKSGNSIDESGRVLRHNPIKYKNRLKKVMGIKKQLCD